MKLKKTWLGLCVWGIYTIFTVFLIAYSTYNLGLLPNNSKIAYTVGFTILSLLAVGVVSFLFCKLNDFIIYDSKVNKQFFNILFIIASVLIIVGAAFYRIYLINAHTVTLTGNVDLYESAKIGNDVQISKSDLLSYVYSNVLRFVLGFTGNSDIVVPLFQAFIQLFTLVVVFLAIYHTMGRMSALVGAVYFGFVPVFVSDFNEVYARNLFFMFFGIELLLLAIFIKNESLDRLNGIWACIYLAITGAACGFMLFIDAGTMMVVVFLIAALFVTDADLKRVLLHDLIIIISAAVLFFVMLIQQGGISRFADSYNAWHVQYFKSLSTLALFTFYNDYKYMYLVTMILMGIVSIAFYRGGRKERVSPWLMLTVLTAFIIPFLGSTRLNCQFVVTLFYGIAISAGVSCITFKGVDMMTEEENATNLEEFVEQESIEQKSIEQENSEQESTECAEHKEIVVPEVQTPKEPKVRYVPEGMVVPEGQEDEEDFTYPSKMKMPEFKDSAPIALNRPAKAKEDATSEKKKKYDFAIETKDGDDFAI